MGCGDAHSWRPWWYIFIAGTSVDSRERLARGCQWQQKRRQSRRYAAGERYYTQTDALATRQLV